MKARHPDGGEAVTPAAAPAVVVLDEWRTADAAKRRALAASTEFPWKYVPLDKTSIHRDLARINCGVTAVQRALELGWMNSKSAVESLKLLNEDLEATWLRTIAFERKLEKAQRKLKKRR